MQFDHWWDTAYLEVGRRQTHQWPICPWSSVPWGCCNPKTWRLWSELWKKKRCLQHPSVLQMHSIQGILPCCNSKENQIPKLICHDMFDQGKGVKMKWTIKHQAMIIYHPCIFLTFKQKGPSLLRKVKLHMEPWQHWLWKKDQWKLWHTVIW